MSKPFSSESHPEVDPEMLQRFHDHLEGKPKQPVRNMNLHEVTPEHVVHGCGVDEHAHRKLATRAAISPDWSTGPKNVIAIRCDFSDAILQQTHDQDVAQLDLAGLHMKRFSYGKTSLTGTVTKVYRMPRSSTEYAAMGVANARAAIEADASALAAADYNLDLFDRIIAHSPRVGALGYAGWGAIGGKNIHTNGLFGWRLLCHELGHTYGLYHACWWRAATPFGQGQWIQYGDTYDIMGGSPDWGPDERLDFNAYSKQLLGWSNEVKPITASGSYRVYAFDTIGANMRPKALAIARNTGDGSSIYVQLRANFDPTKAYVVVGWDTSRGTGLIDAVAWTDVMDALWPSDKALSDTHFVVTPRAYGGTSPNQWIDIDVKIQ